MKKNNYKHLHLVIGGTFDRLHLGHQCFLLKAFFLGNQVTIGLTSNKFSFNKSQQHQIYSFEHRKIQLIDFLTKNNLISRCKIISITDIYGTTIFDKTLEAILITRENYNNALIINHERIKKGLPLLKIELMPLIKSEDRKIIRSQRIRFGEIDRNGKIYGRMFRKKLKLPENLRELLRRPVGEIIKINHQFVGDGLSVPNVKGEETSPLHSIGLNNSILIAVGDIVSQELEKQNIIPAVKIIDLRSQRQPIYRDVINHVSTINKIINPPGFIYPRAVQAIRNSINKYYQTKKSQMLVIRGEEDLLTLPAILIAPLGAIVVYGQKDLGAVVVEVTEEIKQKISNIINQFTVLK